MPWYKQKTTLAGISLILGAIAGYLSQDPAVHISLIQAAVGVWGGITTILARQAIEKSGPSTTTKDAPDMTGQTKTY